MSDHGYQVIVRGSYSLPEFKSRRQAKSTAKALSSSGRVASVFDMENGALVARYTPTTRRAA